MAKQTLKPDLTEARRLFDKGYKLCKLRPYLKWPEGKNWNGQYITRFDDKATGYGILLPANGLCSIDPDNNPLAVKMLAALGFDLEELMTAGVRSRSTRPNSGGRSAFRDPGDLGSVRFAFKDVGTVLELRAKGTNLQDAIPGLVYRTRPDRPELYTQEYVDHKRLDDVGDLPERFYRWWRRMSEDPEFKEDQIRRAEAALGLVAHQDVSNGKQLNFKSAHRQSFNEHNDVEEILLRHGYTKDDASGRLSPPHATGAPGVRPIRGKDGLWQSDHASDPLHGTFDAWTAFVVLEHNRDLEAAEAADRARYDADLAEVFADVSEEAARGERNRFRVVPAGEFAAGPPPAWIVRDVLPEAELAVVYGESGSGKSFLVLDIVAAVVRGVPWQGRKVKRGRAVYVVAEGAGGFRNRLNAYARQYQVELGQEGLGVIADAPNFLRDDDKELAEAIQEAGGASVIVIDTLAQSMPGGNENAGEDMGKVLARCRRLAKTIGALVILVHHSGKDAAKGARGWSGLRAAADAEIEVTRNGDARQMKVTKQKDGDDTGVVVPFRLLPVDVGLDDDLMPVVSCVVDYENAQPVTEVRRLGQVQQRIYDTLAEMGGGPVPMDDLIEAVAQHLTLAPGARDVRRHNTRRAVKSMAEGEGALLLIEGDAVRFPDVPASLHQSASNRGLMQ